MYQKFSLQVHSTISLLYSHTNRLPLQNLHFIFDEVGRRATTLFSMKLIILRPEDASSDCICLRVTTDCSCPVPQEREGIPLHLSFNPHWSSETTTQLLCVDKVSHHHTSPPPCFLPFYPSPMLCLISLEKKIILSVARGFRLHK